MKRVIEFFIWLVFMVGFIAAAWLIVSEKTFSFWLMLGTVAAVATLIYVGVTLKLGASYPGAMRAVVFALPVAACILESIIISILSGVGMTLGTRGLGIHIALWTLVILIELWLTHAGLFIGEQDQECEEVRQSGIRKHNTKD